jgi:hypothetical protein
MLVQADFEIDYMQIQIGVLLLEDIRSALAMHHSHRQNHRSSVTPQSVWHTN